MAHQPDRSETSHHNGNRTNPNRNSNFQARYGKIDFPKFARTDPQGWVFRCERFFRYDGVAEDDKVYATSINLEGTILEWIQSYEITNVQIS